MSNDPRLEAFRPNNELTALLNEVNTLLGPAQAEINRQYEKPRFPLLLLMGAPHSGTTLFMQWLAESGQWSYPTNIIARFYNAPYLGARIQQMLVETDYYGQVSEFKKTEPYKSTLGLTSGALAPHEFWYFWRRFFPLLPDADIVPEEKLAQVDVATLNAELAALEAALGDKPLAMKAMLLNWQIPFLDAAFDKVLFINLKREPAYVVQSMLAGRRKYFGTEALWYSFKPPEYAWLKDLPPVEQVAGQIHYIRTATEAGMAQVSPERILHLDYETFCHNPAAIWQLLTEKMTGLGYAHLGAYSGPGQFKSANSIRTSSAEWVKIQRAVQAAANLR